MRKIAHKLTGPKKRAFLLSIVIMAVALCSLFSPRKAYCADASGPSIFMDIQASEEELLTEVGRAGPGVVMIVVYDDTGKEKARGTGFFIDTEGRILTNADIMKDAYSAEVFSVTNHYGDVTILNRDENIDLALLRVKAADETALELDFEHKIIPGERVLVIGKSHYMENTVSEGLISDVISINLALELIKIQTTAPISSLKSSREGPLFTREGKVIGVTTSTIKEQESLPWMSGEVFNAVSIRSVKPFFSGPNEIEHLQYSGSRVRSRWFIRRVKEYAVSSFIYLYRLGFPKIIVIVFVFIIFISLLQWIYIKLMKRIRPGK